MLNIIRRSPMLGLLAGLVLGACVAGAAVWAAAAFIAPGALTITVEDDDVETTLTARNGALSGAEAYGTTVTGLVVGSASLDVKATLSSPVVGATRTLELRCYSGEDSDSDGYGDAACATTSTLTFAAGATEAVLADWSLSLTDDSDETVVDQEIKIKGTWK